MPAVHRHDTDHPIIRSSDRTLPDFEDGALAGWRAA